MGDIFLIVRATFVLIAIQAQVIVGQNGSPEQAIFSNVPYGSNPLQIMDIYLPAGRNTTITKVIMLIHGGGWSSGSKEDMNFFVPFFYNTFPQHAIVNIDYQLATIQSPGWPKQILDVYFAIQFLKSKAGEYQMNPSFGLVGVSAGAHLAMLYGYGYDATKDVKVICDIVGPANIADPYYTGNRAFDPLIFSLVGNVSFKDNPWLYYTVSPLIHVNAASPKTISFYGDSDYLVNVGQGEALEDALDYYGAYNKYYLYPGGGHFVFTDAQYAHMYKKITYWFKNYL